MARKQPIQLDMIAALTLATPAPGGGAKPKLCDLYCCSGGAGMGFIRAGFDVTGVDIVSRPAYPGRFIQADALQYLIDHGQEYDAVYGSPPCQFFSNATPSEVRDQYPGPEQFAQLREVCDQYGLPLIMENVRDAKEYLDLMSTPYDPMGVEGTMPQESDYQRGWRKPIMLCGQYFGLPIIRHRFFEVGGIAIPQPEEVEHYGTVAGGEIVTVAGHGADNAKGNSAIAVWQTAMGMPWVHNAHELAEAIPPAYTEYLGAYLMAWL